MNERYALTYDNCTYDNSLSAERWALPRWSWVAADSGCQTTYTNTPQLLTTKDSWQKQRHLLTPGHHIFTCKYCNSTTANRHSQHQKENVHRSSTLPSRKTKQKHHRRGLDGRYWQRLKRSELDTVAGALFGGRSCTVGTRVVLVLVNKFTQRNAKQF